ncbi:MAG: four-carbon acid sugar kinase family protein [Alkalibacterium sp.]|nr:four-carbon acid sugar kinase family protein [Alkalibacterium sp.]
MKLTCLVIADDFTGANDTGVQMKNRGLPVQVNVNPSTVQPDHSVVLDTETRHSNSKEAYEKVRHVTRSLLREHSYDLVYKKMDSTLRGNVTEEIRAVAEVYQPDRLIFAPAFPEIQRTTVDGVQLIKGVPLLETEFARDPLSPVKVQNIRELMDELCEKEVAHHTCEDIEKGWIDLTHIKCHTFDSQTHEHLVAVVRSVIYTREKILWVGSAGLAHALFDVLLPTKPSLAVLGSISEVSLKQLKVAEEKDVQIYKLNVEDLGQTSDSSSFSTDIISLLNTGKDVILTAAKTKEDYRQTIAFGKSMGYSESQCSHYIQQILAKITREVLAQTHVSGLFLTGGATAISVMETLESTSVTIKEELSTGMVRSELNDGLFKGLSIITKAGAFGHEEDIVYALKKLKEVSL